MVMEPTPVPTLQEDADTVVLLQTIQHAAFLLRKRALLSEVAESALRDLKADEHVAYLLVRAQQACEEEELRQSVEIQFVLS